MLAIPADLFISPHLESRKGEAIKNQSGQAAERAETITKQLPDNSSSEKRHKSAVFQPVFLYPKHLFKYKVKLVRPPPSRK
jgi:hypothetical protein